VSTAGVLRRDRSLVHSLRVSGSLDSADVNGVPTSNRAMAVRSASPIREPRRLHPNSSSSSSVRSSAVRSRPWGGIRVRRRSSWSAR